MHTANFLTVETVWGSLCFLALVLSVARIYRMNTREAVGLALSLLCAGGSLWGFLALALSL